MTEDVRALLYPFGFLSSIAFGLRFFFQWLESEKKQVSVTPKLFWQLSLLGNILLLIHSLIQVHFPMSLCQSINATCAYRNLNLMQKSKTPLSLVTTTLVLITIVASVCSYFYLQGTWILPPSFFFGASRPESSPWMHVLGSIGIFCYSIRFWIQWWHAEKSHQSHLPTFFWWLSLMGASLSLIYFYYLGDLVNIIGPLVSFIPYSRNLWLLYKAGQKV